MTKTKRFLMTLAALFAMTAGAWADGTLQVTELKASDISAWSGDETTVSAADLPGFKAMTFDEAKAWAEAPASGSVILIYAFDGNDAKYVHFYDGEYIESYSQTLSRDMIYNALGSIATFYTSGASSEPSAQTVAVTPVTGQTNQWTLTMPAGNVVFQVEYDPWKVTLQQTDNGTVEAVTAGGDGVTDNTDGTYSVVPGKSITLKATPAEGYRLAGWYKVDGAALAALTEADGAVADAEAGTLTLTPEADMTIRAEFAALTYTVTLNDKTYQTNANVTATVDGSDATITDGKIEGVTKGQTVILKANTGYKFRKVEVKKGAALKTLTVNSKQLNYAEGDTWQQAIDRPENAGSGWSVQGNHIFNGGYTLFINDVAISVYVSPGDTIDATKNYSLEAD